MIAATNRKELTTLLLVAAIVGLVALVYSESFVSMGRAWTYSAYSHGVIVFPVSAYLLWRLRAPLAELELRPWPPGMAILAAVVLLWILGRAVGVQAAEHLASILLIPVAVATCLGLALARQALFPLLFLLAAVPIGDVLIPYLMRITADVSAVLLRAVGVPVLREGQFLTLPGGVFEIADVCSGLRYLIAGTVVGLLFAYFMYRDAWKRWAFVAVTALSLIVANGIRAFIVMLVASATELRVLGGNDHVYFGWFLFAGVIGALFWFGARYADHAPATADSHVSTSAVGRTTFPVVLILGLLTLALTAYPFVRAFSGAWLLLPLGALALWIASRFFLRVTAVGSPDVVGTSAYRQGGAAAVICLTAGLLAAGPILASRLRADDSVPPRTAALPAVDSCGAPQSWVGGWKPELAGADFGAAGSYVCDGYTVDVYIAGYQHNAQGRELVGDDSRLMADEWRRYAADDAALFAAGDGTSKVVNEIRVDGPGLDSLVWYWYAVGNRTATGATAAKVLQTLELLFEGRTDGAMYWLATSSEPSTAAGRERLAAVARAIETARSSGILSAGSGT